MANEKYVVVRSMGEFEDCLGLYDTIEAAIGKAYMVAFDDSEACEPKERIERLRFNDGYGDQWTFEIVDDETWKWLESVHVLLVKQGGVE